MARYLTAGAIAAALARETDEVFLVLLTLDHVSLESPIRVVANTESIVSNGLTYVAYPFEFVLPGDVADQTPQAQLSIDNVDRVIIEALRPLTSAPRVAVQVVLASAPDDVQLEVSDLVLRDVDFDVSTVTGVLAWEDPFERKFPKGKYTPSRAPGLFS